jgi:hypothetical protein
MRAWPPAVAEVPLRPGMAMGRRRVAKAHQQQRRQRREVVPACSSLGDNVHHHDRRGTLDHHSGAGVRQVGWWRLVEEAHRRGPERRRTEARLAHAP